MYQSAIFLCSAVLFLVQLPVHAGDIFKWVDERGVTHYADKPSNAEESVALDAEQLPRLNIGQPTPQMAPLKLSKRARRQAVRKADSGADCSRYRSEISKLEHSLRQGYVEPAGTRMRERKRHWTALLYRHCY